MRTTLITAVILLNVVALNGQDNPDSTGCSVLFDVPTTSAADPIMSTVSNTRCQMLLCYSSNVFVCQAGNQLETYTKINATSGSQQMLGRGVFGKKTDLLICCTIKLIGRNFLQVF